MKLSLLKRCQWLFPTVVPMWRKSHFASCTASNKNSTSIYGQKNPDSGWAVMEYFQLCCLCWLEQKAEEGKILIWAIPAPSDRAWWYQVMVVGPAQDPADSGKIQSQLSPTPGKVHCGGGSPLRWTDQCFGNMGFQRFRLCTYFHYLYLKLPTKNKNSCL